MYDNWRLFRADGWFISKRKKEVTRHLLRDGFPVPPDKPPFARAGERGGIPSLASSLSLPRQGSYGTRDRAAPSAPAPARDGPPRPPSPAAGACSPGTGRGPSPPAEPSRRGWGAARLSSWERQDGPAAGRGRGLRAAVPRRRPRARPARRRGVAAAARPPPAAKMAERQHHNAAARPPSAPPRRAGGAGGCGAAASRRAGGDSPRQGRRWPTAERPAATGRGDRGAEPSGRAGRARGYPVARPAGRGRSPARRRGQDGASLARPPGAAARGGGSGGCRSPGRAASAAPRVPAQGRKASCREDSGVSSAPDWTAAGRALRLRRGRCGGRYRAAHGRCSALSSLSPSSSHRYLSSRHLRRPRHMG